VLFPSSFDQEYLDQQYGCKYIINFHKRTRKKAIYQSSPAVSPAAGAITAVFAPAAAYLGGAGSKNGSVCSSMAVIGLRREQIVAVLRQQHRRDTIICVSL
jgi:hypothetical protein